MNGCNKVTKKGRRRRKEDWTITSSRTTVTGEGNHKEVQRNYIYSFIACIYDIVGAVENSVIELRLMYRDRLYNTHM